MSLTMWPLKLGSVAPSRVSVPDERGLANWPAIRPTFTTGKPAEYCSTTAIWRMTFSLSLMASALLKSNDSAQSPACSTIAFPLATRAS